MSRQSGTWLDGPAATVTGVGARAVEEPLLKPPFDVLIAHVRMTPSEILSHQVEPRAEQVERGAERVGDGSSGGLAAGWQWAHAATLRLSHRPDKRTERAPEAIAAALLRSATKDWSFGYSQAGSRRRLGAAPSSCS